MLQVTELGSSGVWNRQLGSALVQNLHVLWPLKKRELP